MPPIPTYRTQLHRTDRILKDWILKERLAFNRVPSLTVSELIKVLPKNCKKQLGELKPIDPTFRKMSSGFNNVSDVWIELSRFIGIGDFSPEQAIFGTVSVFLDKENVRVKLHSATDEPSRENLIEVFCLNEPDFQGVIGYEGDRLSFPQSIFDAVIERRLNVYNLNCENLSDVLLIPIDLDSNLLNSPELEAEHRAEAAADARLETMADVQEHIETIGDLMTEEDRQAERMAEVYSDASTALDDSDTES